MCEFSAKQRRLIEKRDELKRVYRAVSAPKMASIRSKDEIMFGLRNYEETLKYKDREISPEFPPIAGYTGHIPRVKGNEESLSQRYNTVVRRGLTLLREEKAKKETLKEAQTKIERIFNSADPKFSYKDKDFK